MKGPAVIFAVLLSGLGGFGAAKVWRGGQENEVDSSALDAKSSPERGGHLSQSTRVREEGDRASQPPHVQLMDHARPGGRDALALLDKFARDRLAAHGGSLTFHREWLLRLMFDEDPATALAFLDGIEDRTFAAELTRLMIFAPPRRTLPLLADWVKEHEDLAYRQEILRNMIWTWRREDPAAALAAIDALPEGADHSGLRALLMDRIPVRSQLATLEKFSVPDQEAFFTAHARNLSVTVPEDIFAAVTKLPDSPGRDGAMASILQNWAARDPFRTVAAIEKLGDPALEAQGFREVAYGWSGVDSSRASKWVDSLPPGPSRDAASSGLAEELAAEQPDMAFKWAESISDPDRRLESMQQVVTAWRNEDPAAAEAALANSKLSESDRRSLAPSTKEKSP